MTPFEKLRMLFKNLEGYIPGSENEKIFWEAIAQESSALATLARRQATKEKKS